MYFKIYFLNSTLGIEVNHAGEIFAGSRDDIGQLLKDNGYSFSGTVKIDDFYIKNTKSWSCNDIKPLITVFVQNWE